MISVSFCAKLENIFCVDHCIAEFSKCAEEA